MSYPAYPTLANKPDSRKYQVTQEDPAIRSPLEGGYVASRPRHTRATMRQTWNISYTFVPDSDKDALVSFVNTVKGGSNIFTWTNPEDGVLYYVRFKQMPSYKYVGAGSSRRWDIDFALEQV